MTKSIYIICILSYFLNCSVSAQTIKRITLSADEEYIEHIALANDSKDMDVMIKFAFDEMANKISVVLMSYRPLFVFQEDTYYKQVVKRRKLRPERLSYVVSEPSFKIPLTKVIRRQIPSPKKKFVFKRWISYEGLQPVLKENKLVNDFIEQDFDILQKRNELKVSFHQLFVMDSEVVGHLKQKYLLSYFRDLNIEYHISLKRNPCLGMETEIEQATASLRSVQEAHDTFLNSFMLKDIESEEQYAQFVGLKNILIKQFPINKTETKCPEIQSLWEKYNKYVDAIGKVECVWSKSSPKQGVNVEMLLKDARQIDFLVSTWISSVDKVEKRDLHIQCLKLVENAYDHVDTYGIVNEAQQHAWNVFLKAEQYFQTTINANKQ